MKTITTIIALVFVLVGVQNAHAYVPTGVEVQQSTSTKVIKLEKDNTWKIVLKQKPGLRTQIRIRNAARKTVFLDKTSKAFYHVNVALGKLPEGIYQVEIASKLGMQQYELQVD